MNKSQGHFRVFQRIVKRYKFGIVNLCNLSVSLQLIFACNTDYLDPMGFICYNQ